MTSAATRAACIALSAALLWGCATAPSASVDMPPGEPATLQPGERARLPDGSRLDYVGVRSDSRCPPAVTCIHAGWVELDFAHESATGTREALVLSTRPGVGPARAGAWRVELIEVGRGASPLARVRASAAAE